ncbi:MAG TPA: amidohydrolase family protein [Candidatus Cloacimonadota bacterium]|nr:amidohydrolase family protein [Candidatus Cloacimonadota bacterium]
MKLFTNASLPTSSNALKRVNILFDETIKKVSVNPIETEEPCEEIDLGGRIVLPGAIDAHCHIVDSVEPSEAISRLSRMALLGGWTTVSELSFFSPLPIFDFRDFKHLQSFIDAASYVFMPLWANIEIENYPYHAEAALELWTRGALGLTIFSPSPSEALTELSFTEIMDLFIDIYESDTAFVFQGWDQEAYQSPSFEAQTDAIKKILRRMQENPIHVPRVGSWATIEFINSISKRSDISFALNVMDLMDTFGVEGLPGREHDLEENKDLLSELIRTNKLYMVSNHASLSDSQGDRVFRVETPATMPYSYLWMLSEFWKKRKVPLATVIKMCSENAAKRLGIYPMKGSLDPGSDADFVIYNPDGITAMPLPEGGSIDLTGSIESIWLRGTLAVQNGEVKERHGGFLARTNTPKRRHNNSTWI